MSSDILSALKKFDRIFKAAKIASDEMGSGSDNEIQYPSGQFTGTISSFKLEEIGKEKKLVLKRTFTMVKATTEKYNGYTVTDTKFMTTHKAIGFVITLFKQLGIAEANNISGMADFLTLINIANKIENNFLCGLTYKEYNGKDYPQISVLKKLDVAEKTHIEIKQPAEIIEEIPEQVDEVVESSQEEIIDDFAEDFQADEGLTEEIKGKTQSIKEDEAEVFYNDSDVPEIPELSPVKKQKEVQTPNALNKYLKKLQAFCFTYDLEIADLKALTVDKVIEGIKEKAVHGFNDLESTEKTLLKKVGLENLINNLPF